jgi:hypothetical protein
MYHVLRGDWRNPVESLPVDLFSYERLKEYWTGVPSAAVVGAQMTPVSCPIAWYLRYRTGRPWRVMAEMAYTIPPDHVIRTGAEVDLYSIQMPLWIRQLILSLDHCATDDRGYVLAGEALIQLANVERKSSDGKYDCS